MADIERVGKARISNYPPEQAAPSAEQLRELQAQIDQLKRVFPVSRFAICSTSTAFTNAIIVKLGNSTNMKFL